MDVISVCSGAGGMDLGFHRAECRTVALCEADPWRRRLLARHWPGVPCWPDLTTLDPAELPRADVLIGGTPCQDLSHAGRRAGLDGARSGLFWDYCRVRNALGIEWAVWENVEGALSSNQGLDFACVLGAFVGADVVVPSGGWPGAGVAAGPWGGCVWRVLDAQHFGVPQRRRRVFVVGRLGGPCPPEVLLEPEGSRRDSAEGESAWTDFAGPVGGGAHGAGRRTIDDDNYVIAAPLTRGSSSRGVSEPGRRMEDDVNLAVVGTLQAKSPESGGWRIGPDEAAAGQLVVGASIDGDGVRAPDELAGRMDVAAVSENQRGEVLETPYSHQLTTGGGKPGQGYPMVRIASIHPDAIGRDGISKTPSLNGGSVRLRDSGLGVQQDVSYTLGTGAPPAVGPVPDLGGDHCAVDLQPDGRRYAACGDGVVANVAEWIARRLMFASEGCDD